MNIIANYATRTVAKVGVGLCVNNVVGRVVSNALPPYLSAPVRVVTTVGTAGLGIAASHLTDAEIDKTWDECFGKTKMPFSG